MPFFRVSFSPIFSRTGYQKKANFLEQGEKNFFSWAQTRTNLGRVPPLGGWPSCAQAQKVVAPLRLHRPCYKINFALSLKTGTTEHRQTDKVLDVAEEKENCRPLPYKSARLWYVLQVVQKLFNKLLLVDWAFRMVHLFTCQAFVWCQHAQLSWHGNTEGGVVVSLCEQENFSLINGL